MNPTSQRTTNIPKVATPNSTQAVTQNIHPENIKKKSYINKEI